MLNSSILGVFDWNDWHQFGNFEHEYDETMQILI